MLLRSKNIIFFQNNSSPSSASQNEESKVSRKVRFVEGKIPIRRSKSFTSGTKTNDENHSQNFNEKIPPKKFNKSFKGKRKEFFDLQKPTNIKIELQTNSGERKCILDENVALANVKCDLRNCRNILNHNDIKVKTFSYPNIEKKKEKHKSQNFYQVGDKSQSLTKKKSVCVSETIKTASSAVTKAEEMAKDEEKQLEEKFTKVAIDDSN